MKPDHPSAGPIPFPVVSPTRIPKQRYYDRKFYDLEVERFWPRVWQMACRLEEIPNPGDYVEYEILDQSIIVVRLDALRVKAYYNACRHRGVQLVKDRGNARQGFSCPFHGWRFSLEGENTFLYQPDLFAEAERDKDDLRLRECRVELWGGCAFINMDDDAPPLRASLEPFASYHEARGAEKMRSEWWYSAVVPTNWKLAMEAFMEGYHLMRTHPQFNLPGPESGSRAVYRPVGSGRAGNAISASFLDGNTGSAELVERFIQYMKTLATGMGSMILEKDIRVAEGLRGIQLPGDPAEAAREWNRALNAALTTEHRKAGIPMPDLNELAPSTTTSVQFCFPNFFLLPLYGNMASYRFRPLGPESTLFELWSLTLFPEGKEPAESIRTPVPMSTSDPRWPPIPAQDFTNLPRQQAGLHAKGFEFMRLSPEVEGMISHFHQVLDGYLASVDSSELLLVVQQVSGPIDATSRGMLLEASSAG